MPLDCHDKSVAGASHAGLLRNMPVIRLILRQMDVDIDVDKDRLWIEAAFLTAKGNEDR